MTCGACYAASYQNGQEAALHQSTESGDGPEELVWWDLVTGGLESAEMLDSGVGNTGGYWNVY